MEESTSGTMEGRPDGLDSVFPEDPPAVKKQEPEKKIAPENTLAMKKCAEILASAISKDQTLGSLQYIYLEGAPDTEAGILWASNGRMLVRWEPCREQLEYMGIPGPGFYYPIKEKKSGSGFYFRPVLDAGSPVNFNRAHPMYNGDIRNGKLIQGSDLEIASYSAEERTNDIIIWCVKEGAAFNPVFMKEMDSVRWDSWKYKEDTAKKAYMFMPKTNTDIAAFSVVIMPLNLNYK